MTVHYSGLSDLRNNALEIFVEELNARIEAGEAFCTCEVCLQDMAAIVLNNVPPLYYCSIFEKFNPAGSMHVQAEKVRERVREELPKAIDLVARHSHH